jgi:hypothetical protein
MKKTAICNGMVLAGLIATSAAQVLPVAALLGVGQVARAAASDRNESYPFRRGTRCVVRLTELGAHAGIISAL